MTLPQCANARGYAKKPYPSPEAARRDLARKRRWRRGDRYPVAYRCPAGGHYHLTTSRAER